MDPLSAAVPAAICITASITTRSALILRDPDLLTELAHQRLVRVFISFTTLNADLKRIMESRAASPGARLKVIRRLREAGVPVGIITAPMIPVINDMELEKLLQAGREAGAISAGYTLLRLPHEVRPLFEQWLLEHFPDRAGHVLSLIRQSRGGRDHDSRFGHRLRGEGPFADLYAPPSADRSVLTTTIQKKDIRHERCPRPH